MVSLFSLIHGIAIASLMHSSDESQPELVIHPEVTSVDDDAHIQTDMSFPGQRPLKKATVKCGDNLQAVISMQNTKASMADAVHIEYAVGHVVAKIMNKVVQNCTGIRYNRTLAPLESVSMQYMLKPAADLALGAYDLAVRVFYINDQRETKMKSFTVEFEIVSAGYFRSARYALFALTFIIGIVVIVWLFKGDKPMKEVKDHASLADLQSNPAVAEAVPKEHLQYVKARKAKARGRNIQSPTN